MGHKTHPTGFRLGIIKDWNTHWIVPKAKQYRELAPYVDGTKGKLIARLPIEWALRRDVDDSGVAKGFSGTADIDLTYWNKHKDSQTPDNRRLYPAEWEMIRPNLYAQAQGIRAPDRQSYTGTLWYRTEVELTAEEAAGAHIRFPGIFNESYAYINGEQILDQFAQAVEAARLLGVDPAGTAGYRIGLSVVEEVTTNGTIEILLDDLGGGNPPEHAGIKGIMILATDGPAPLPDEDCGNGIDDDRDGDVDCDDSDCAALAACLPDEICNNNIDDDRDGATDCEDTDCVDDADCAGPGEATFVRGDSNSDGSVNLTDGVIPLLFVFSGGAAPG